MVPSGWRKYTADTKSQMAPSWVPAFVARAPPTVDGMPTRHSMPPRPMAAASRIIVERPAPQPMVTSSPWNSMRPRHPSILSTIPRKPLSRTSVLCPLPRRATGSFSLSANISVFRTSSTSCGMMKMSAGPPQRSDVWNASGSLKRTSPRISPSMQVSFSAQGAVRGRACGQPLPQLVRHRPDVAGPEGQDQVAGPNGVEDSLHHLAPVTHVSDVAAGPSSDPLGQAPGMDPGDRRLARRIDVGHEQHVGVVERRQKLVVEVERPGVAVRLEHDHAAAREALAGGRQRRPDLRRVMAVVVDQQDAGHLALDLEASLDPGEGGERVGHVVDAGYLKAELAERVSPVKHLEARGQLAQPHGSGHEIGGRGEPVGDDALLDARKDRLDVRL